MPGLLQRNLQCFYCGQKSRNTHKGIPRSWHCRNCDAVNYLDERGQITEPPSELQTTPTANHVQYARPVARAISPEPTQPDQIFCSRCQKNQHILTQALAAYLPSEDDPQYAEYEKDFDNYRRMMEERYPQVCENCAPRVNDRMRAAHYTAKTDHLRRMVQKTRSEIPRYGGWGWRNWVVFLVGSLYLSSVLSGLLWHIAGVLVRPEDGLRELDDPGFRTCAVQAIGSKEIEPACFHLLYPRAKLAVLCGLLSFWWNAKLQEKVTVPGRRLRGLNSHMGLQAIVITLRAISLWCFGDVRPIENALQAFRAGHLFMFVFTFVSSIMSLYLVKVDRKPTFSFTQGPGPLIPTAPRQPSTTTAYRPGIEGFASSFPIDKLAESTSAYEPPSPTETDYSTITTQPTTPSTHRTSITSYDENQMDWTPTRPNVYYPPQKRSSPTPAKPPVTAFYPYGQAPTPQISQQVNNPFRGTLPPAPKPPVHNMLNPFPQPTFTAPALTQKKDFFQSMMIDKGSFGKDPQAEKRRDYEFREARLRLREEVPTTGLEGMLDSMFSLRENDTSAEAQSTAGERAVARPKTQSQGGVRHQSAETQDMGAPGKDAGAGGESGIQAAGQILLIACVPILAGAVAAWYGGFYQSGT